MRTVRSHEPPFFAATLLAIALFATAGCHKTHAMSASAAVPASEGTVRATEGADGNTDVTLWVKHLATPSKVQPDATVYVVWFQPRSGVAQNVGAMAVDDNLDGRFDGSTAHRQFAVTVTPEPHGEVATPSHASVFSTQVDRDQ